MTLVVDPQAQTALKRKWAQWKSNCGKFGWGDQPMVSNHFSSSLTETSRATIGAELPAVLGCLSSPQEESNDVPSKVPANGNGQQKRSKSCSNGEVDTNRMEASVI